jgi:hypothetical protein
LWTWDWADQDNGRWKTGVDASGSHTVADCVTRHIEIYSTERACDDRYCAVAVGWGFDEMSCVELRDVPGATKPLARYCGAEVEHALWSWPQRMTVRLKSTEERNAIDGGRLLVQVVSASTGVSSNSVSVGR